MICKKNLITNLGRVLTISRVQVRSFFLVLTASFGLFCLRSCLLAIITSTARDAVRNHVTRSVVGRLPKIQNGGCSVIADNLRLLRIGVSVSRLRTGKESVFLPIPLHLNEPMRATESIWNR